MDRINTILQSEYGIVAKDISPAIGGCAALAYKVDSEQGTYFLKVYEKQKSGTAAILEKLNLCMAVASWLENNTRLHGRINAPLLTKQGDVRAETQDNAYLLFTYIDGITPRFTPLTIYQQEELAEIVGELHRHGEDMPFDFSSVQETYEIPCAVLMKTPPKPESILYRHYNMLMRAIDRVHRLAEKVKAESLPFVLCHTDIHGWNLMQSEKMILIDWETIRFAPTEADLYTFWGDWYLGGANWVSYWDTFLPVYQRLRPEYAVREEILRFYQLRRHFEEVDDFYREYLYDDITEEKKHEIISCLERECTILNTLIQQ